MSGGGAWETRRKRKGAGARSAGEVKGPRCVPTWSWGTRGGSEAGASGVRRTVM